MRAISDPTWHYPNPETILNYEEEIDELLKWEDASGMKSGIKPEYEQKKAQASQEQ